MRTYRPYKFWTKTQLKTHLSKLINAFNLDKTIKALVEKAILSENWDVTLDYDGCSIVQDLYHPCLSCFIHDYLWKSGQGGKESDELFYYLMLAEGTDLARAKRRWFFVRVGWIFYYRWVHLKNRNINPYTEAFMNALEYVRNKYAKQDTQILKQNGNR